MNDGFTSLYNYSHPYTPMQVGSTRLHRQALFYFRDTELPNNQ
jgi:hypothetical protein